MFEKLVEKILLTRLGGLIQDLDRNQLKVNIWSGKIVLENVRLDPRILLKLKLPLIFKYTRIAKISVTVPWTALTSKSVEISLDGIYCIVVPFQKEEWKFDLGIFVDKIKEGLKNYEMLWEIESEGKKIAESEGSQGGSYMESLKNSILANLKINLGSMHFRFEDCYKTSEYSMGLLINSINSSPEESGSVQLEIFMLSVYINVQGSHFKSPEADFNKPFANDSIINRKEYIVSTTINLSKKGFEKIISAKIENLRFEYTHLQYIYSIRFFRKFSKYNLFLAKQIEQQKYLIFAPFERSAASLWKFAKNAIMALIRQKRNLVNVFVMPIRNKIFHMKTFKSLFLKWNNEKLTTSEEFLFNRVLFLCEWDDLLRWELEILGENKMKKKKGGGWMSYFSRSSGADKEEPDSLLNLTESEKPIWKMTCKCVFEQIDLKLATYNLEHKLIQSQTVQLSQCSLGAVLCEESTSILTSIDSLKISYQDLESQHPILSINKSSENPAIVFNSVLYNNIKTPNEIYYESQGADYTINLKSISHLMNFISIKDLSAKNKTEIFDKLKNIQEKAMSQITDIFYYEKIYKISLKMPIIQITLPVPSGNFVMRFHELHILDGNAAEIPNYTSIETGCSLEVLHNDYPLVPAFKVNFIISTLAKKFLKLKWECRKSDFDELCDIQVKGSIQKISVNFTFSIINDLKYIQNNTKIQESRESLLLDKKSIIKNMDLMQSIVLNNGYTKQKCVAVLKDDAIYYFVDSKGNYAFDYVIFSGGIVSFSEDTIKIVTKSRLMQMSFTKLEVANRWLEKLQENSGPPQQIIKEKSFEKKVFYFDFSIEHSVIQLISADNVQEYSLEFKKQLFVLESNPFTQLFVIQSSGIKVKDKNNINLLAFGGHNTSEKITIKHISPDSKDFTDVNLVIQATLNGGRVFCHHSALKQLITSASNLGNYDKEETNKKEVLFKISCDYKIANFSIIFSKDSIDQGKFALDVFSGQVFYDGIRSFFKAELNNLSVNWLEKDSKIFAPLIKSNPEKSIALNVETCSDYLKTQLNVPLVNVVIIPRVLVRLYKYFNYLIPNVKPKKTAVQDVKTTFEIDAGVKLEDLMIKAKDSCSSEQELNIKIKDIDFAMDSSGVKVEVTDIKALIDVEIFAGNFIRVKLGKSVAEIKFGEFLIKVCPNDCNIFLQLMNLPKISAKTERNFEKIIEEVKEEPKEIEWNAAESLIIEDANSEKPMNIEKQSAENKDGEWKVDLEWNKFNFAMENLGKSMEFSFSELKIAQMQNKEKDLIHASIKSASLKYETIMIMDLLHNQLEPEYIIIVCSDKLKNIQEMIISEIKVNYDTNLINFLQDFSKAIKFPTRQTAISDKSEESSIKYKVSLKKVILIIDFQNIITSITQEIDIEYISTPYSVKLQLNNFSITKQTEFMTISDLQLTMTSSPINSTQLKFSTINLNFNIEDLLYFKNFYFSSLPKRDNQPPPKPSSAPQTTHYCLDFNSIKLNFLSSKRATLFEILISFQDFKGVSDSSLKISTEFEFLVQYQNPLLQLFESFIEPTIFRLSLTIDSSIKVNLEALPNSVLCLNLTDSTIQHLYNLYYSGLEGVHPFTILNTTGCKIIIGSTDGESILIEDQEFKEFIPPTENTKLSCTVMLSEGHSETLTKIPLFSQEVQSHYISNHICITTQVGIVNQYMQLNISSPIQVKNHTEIELQVAFLTTAAEGGIHLAKMCGPHSVIPVPLSCVKGFFALIPHGTERKECKILEIEALRQKDWICKSGDYYFLMQLEKNTMHIRSTLAISNYLPIDLTVSIKNDKSTIETMKKIDYFFAVDKSIKISILVKGFFQVNDYVVFTKSPVKKITLKNELLSFEIGCSVSIEHGYALTIYPFVLLVNKTLLPLDFYVSYKGSFICFSENYKDNRIMCGDIETIFARVSNKSSTPLDLKNTLAKFFEVPSETGAFCMLYKIISAKVPNSKAITKIVSFHSRILLNNLMQQEIKVSQCESGEALSVIKAGQITYFNWKDPRANLHMTIKVEGLSLDWSGPFDIEKPNTFYVNTDNSIRFSDSPETIKQFVKVVVKDDNGTMNVFFYNSVESDIQIINQSTHSLLVYQEKFSFPSFISPQSTEYFAWFSQVHKQSLFIQTDYAKERFKFQANLERIGVSEEFRLGDTDKILHVFLKKEANTTILIINESGFSKPEDSIPNLSLTIKLPRIMLSVIQQDIYFKQEVLLITLTDYTNTISQYIDHISWDVRFKDMQIDSQIYEYVVCPVFMISEGENFFRFKGNIIISEKWICLEDIEIAPKSFIMNVDSNSLQSIMKFYKRFISESSFNLSHFLSHTNQEKEVTTAAYVYLSKLEIPAFTTTFSYKNLPGNVKDHFKSYFMNFENMTISFEKLSYKSLYGSPFSLSFLISGFYRKMVMENLDSILKQHGMIGGAMVIGLKISNKLSSVNKKSKKETADVKDVNFYNKRIKGYKAKTNMRFTKYASRSSIMANAPKEETSTIQSFIQMVNNPISGIIGLFSKKKENPDKDEVFVSRQRPTRVFYGRLGIIKPFQEFDSIAAGFFRERKSKYIHYAFYGEVSGIEAQNKQNMMIVGFDKLIALINLDETKVMWKVNPVFMEPLQRDNGMFVFIGVDKRNKKFRIRLRFLEDTAMQELEILVREILADVNS